MPDTDIALITDDEVESNLFDIVRDTDELDADFSSSNLEPGMSPFDRTLFLDTDTYLTDSVHELFDVLDEYDLAIAPSLSQGSVSGVPAPRTQYNTGVVSYRSNDPVRELFTLWNDIYREWREERDVVQNQPSFLKAVYETDVDLFTLSLNYNTRLFSPGALHGDAKILHGRPETGIENAARLINESSRFRAFYRNSYLSRSGAFKVVEDASPRYHLEKSVFERGLKQTLLEAPEYLKERIL
ncbi:hypothetical protein K933_00582 [Candidatus Halobonum tyrrellensis G22]|uniref:Nucleotide-diphospho-sugar transferase domain-containing protein n=2 Tax=Candidatus Halobonum TaxID=1431544 RepID=V4HJS3_9EURY|nr:hypothetical protein K933_00582 [Candidatus Halobonum tyrrellensis G22]